MTVEETHVVLGAAGAAGTAITEALREAGIRVRGVGRRQPATLPRDVEWVTADIGHRREVRQALTGADVVYLAAQPPYHRWHREFPHMLEVVIDAAAEVEAKLVMVDNLYAYGPGSTPMRETTPERATDRKGRVRRTMAEMLRRAHREGRVRTTIGRAADYFGPRADNSALTVLAVAPAALGKTARWLGDLDVAHSVAYLPDIARAYVRLGTSPMADGHTWILPHTGAVTGRQFLAAVADAAQGTAEPAVLTPTMLRLAAPFHRPSRQTLPLLYQWTQPFVVDDSLFRNTFGPFVNTPLEEAVTAAVESYRGSVTEPLR